MTENPYDEIGNYIKSHITAAEDIIATIEIDGRITNELFMVEDGLDFVWERDWWEGENDVKLIDFFPVNEAVRREPINATGTWILDIDDSFPLLRRGWRCSECGRRQTYGTTPYCPYCGRKMEVKR